MPEQIISSPPEKPQPIPFRQVRISVDEDLYHDVQITLVRHRAMSNSGAVNIQIKIFRGVYVEKESFAYIYGPNAAMCEDSGLQRLTKEIFPDGRLAYGFIAEESIKFVYEWLASEGVSA